MTTCKHSDSGCNYPEGDCLGVCMGTKNSIKLPRATAWRHTMDNTEGHKGNGRGIVHITESPRHPFGIPGEDFSESFPVITERLYTEAQIRSAIAKATRSASHDSKEKSAFCSNSQEIERALEHEFKHLNCPHCGGSGHVDDAKEKLRGKDGKVHPTIQCMIDDMNGEIEG